MSDSKIFIDSGGWYALLVSNDRFHQSAKTWMKNFQQSRVSFVTTDYVLDETMTLFKPRQVPSQISSLFDLIEESSHLSLEWIEHDRFFAARDLILRYH